MIPSVRLESSGGVLSTVDMVVQRRDGPRRLRDHDDDNMSDLRGNYLSASFAQQVFKAINFFGRSLWVFGNC